MTKCLPTVQPKIQKITHNFLSHLPNKKTIRRSYSVYFTFVQWIAHVCKLLGNMYLRLHKQKKGMLAISTTLPCVLGCIAKYQHCNSMLCTMYTSYNLGKMTAVEMKMICKCLHSKLPWRTLETKYLKIGMKTREVRQWKVRSFGPGPSLVTGRTNIGRTWDLSIH